MPEVLSDPGTESLSDGAALSDIDSVDCSDFFEESCFLSEKCSFFN